MAPNRQSRWHGIRCRGTTRGVAFWHVGCNVCIARRMRRSDTASSLHIGGPASFRDGRDGQSLLFAKHVCSEQRGTTSKLTDMTKRIYSSPRCDHGWRRQKWARRLACAEYVCFLRQSTRCGTHVNSRTRPISWPSPSPSPIR